MSVISTSEFRLFSLIWFQDVQYADIDHMDERKDFTVDNANFAGLNDYWQSLRKGGMRTVIILVSTFVY